MASGVLLVLFAAWDLLAFGAFVWIVCAALCGLAVAHAPGLIETSGRSARWLWTVGTLAFAAIWVVVLVFAIVYALATWNFAGPNA